MWRERLHGVAWRLAGLGMVMAASLVLVGGFLAGANRPLSDTLVLAGFGVLVPSVLVGWLGLPAAARALPFPEENLS